MAPLVSSFQVAEHIKSHGLHNVVGPHVVTFHDHQCTLLIEAKPYVDEPSITRVMETTWPLSKSEVGDHRWSSCREDRRECRLRA